MMVYAIQGTHGLEGGPISDGRLFERMSCEDVADALSAIGEDAADVRDDADTEAGRRVRGWSAWLRGW